MHEIILPPSLPHVALAKDDLKAGLVSEEVLVRKNPRLNFSCWRLNLSLHLTGMSAGAGLDAVAIKDCNSRAGQSAIAVAVY